MAPNLSSERGSMLRERLQRAGRLCVSLAAATPEALLDRVADLPSKFQFVELRLDYLAFPGTSIPLLAQQLVADPQRLFLVTCRPRSSGGQLTGGAQEELTALLAAAKAGFPLVDLSLESAEQLGLPAMAELRATGAAVLVSWHDFEGMGDLSAVLDRMRPLAADLLKLVPTAQALGNSLDLLQLLRRNSENGSPLPLVAIAMGEPGTLTRVLGPRTGCPFTFAPVSVAEATAPGQIAADQLTQLYRAEQLSPASRLFGVAGDPVRSSLSPLMFNTVFRETGRDAAYLPLLVRDPEALFRAARELPLDGFSVTMPLKQAVLPFLTSVEPLALRIGAVNTVYQQEGRFHGYNTDVAGIVAPLERRLVLRGARVLVLGAGGAARAAVFGCAERGASVWVANRSTERAASLAAEAGAAVLPNAALGHESFDVLIHATPAGMKTSDRALPLAEEELRAALVFDLVYNPMDTPLLQLARQKGLQTIAGVEMFLHQGARQFEIWTGESAPFDLMESSVRAALTERDAG